MVGFGIELSENCEDGGLSAPVIADWVSSNPAVAMVDNTGFPNIGTARDGKRELTVQGLKPGRAVITLFALSFDSDGIPLAMGPYWLDVTVVEPGGFEPAASLWDQIVEVLSSIWNFIVTYIFFGWLWQKKPLTAEQSANQSMKDRAASAINTYSSWGRMTMEQRQAALTDLLGQAETILGVEPQNIEFHNYGVYASGGISMGRYYPDAGTLATTTGTVQIAAKTMVINTHPEAIGREYIRSTVFHEIRHAYQSEAREDINKHVVSQTTYNYWADIYLKTVEDGMEAYMSSPREWDARQLAGQSHMYNGRNVTPVYRANWPS